MFNFFDHPKLNKKLKKVAIIQGFKECFNTDQLAIAVQIWSNYTEILLKRVCEITEVQV